MDDAFIRTRMLIGDSAVEKLGRASVAVFGIGGVGSYTAEALARCAVGSISLFDGDRVSVSNLNRQLPATRQTVGEYKAAVMKRRIESINPGALINANICFYDNETAPEIPLSGFDYIVDAIDTVTCKLLLIENAVAAGIPVISSMGAGNKLDPGRFEVADIYKTSVCPLARVMRRELKKRGIKALKVVYSKEPPVKPMAFDGSYEEISLLKKRQTPGSIAFVPSAAGLLIAGEVVRDIIGLPR